MKPLFFSTPVRLTLASAIAVNVSLSSFAMAEESSTDTPALALLEEVVVTGNLVEQTVFETLGSVDVVTQDEIFIQQPQDLAELLSRQTGADIRSSGSRGSVTSVFTRATGSAYTLFLVNGLRINTATDGGAAFQTIDPEILEKVEYLKGPRSSVYGSEALGGVVQLFTRGSTDESTAYVTQEIGTQETLRTAGGVSGKLNNLSYAVGGSFLSSEGIDSTLGTDGSNGDQDAFHRANINLFANYAVNDDFTVRLTHLSSEGRTDYDAFERTPYNKARLDTTGLSIDGRLTDAWRLDLSVGRTDSQLFDLDFVSPNKGETSTVRDQVRLENTLTFVEGQTTKVGVDYYRDNVTGFSEFSGRTSYEAADGAPIDERDNTSAFLQHQADFGRFDIVAGARHDDNSDYGSQTTGSVAAGAYLTDHQRAYVSWSQGFLAPTFNQLYFPDFGEPGLKPQESNNWELGYKYNAANTALTFALYRNDLNNQIVNENNQVRNVDVSRIEGIEFALTQRLGNWLGEIGITALKTKDRTTKERLKFFAERTAFVDVSYQAEQWTAGILLQAQGDRLVGFVTPEKLGGYGLLNTYASWQVTDAFSVRLRVNNLLEKEYLLASNFNTYGRNGSLKFQYNF